MTRTFKIYVNSLHEKQKERRDPLSLSLSLSLVVDLTQISLIVVSSEVPISIPSDSQLTRENRPGLRLDFQET